MPSTRLVFATLIAVVLVGPLGGAPRAQYDYYLTGEAADATGLTEFGLGLMRGGTDVDALFTWMSDRAGGGDSWSSGRRARMATPIRLRPRPLRTPSKRSCSRTAPGGSIY